MQTSSVQQPEARDQLALRKIPVQRRAKKTVDRILDTAAVLVDEVGVVAFTTNLLAQRSGIRIRTIYRYFPSKLGILMALTVRLYGDITDQMQAFSEFADPERDWRAAVDRWIEEIMVWTRDQPAARLLIDWGQGIPELMAMLESPYDQTLWLEGDTTILRPIDSVFDGEFDISIAQDYNNKGLVTTLYNAGVIALRSTERTRDFLRDTWDRWFKSNTRFTEQDIMYKLLKGEYAVLNLQLLDCNVWNVRPALANAMPEEKRADTRILHSRGHRLLDPPKYWEQYR